MAEIRPYRDTDFTDVQDNLVAADMFDEVWDSRHNLAAMIAARPSSIWVASQDGKVVGQIYSVPFGVDAVYLFRLAVAEKYRRHGIASQLIEFVDNELRQEGFKEVCLLADAKNVELIEFYKKRKYITSGHPYVALWKPLE